jgi:hypothetical protein
MRSILFTFLSIFSSITLFAQDSSKPHEPKTQLEKVNLEIGTIIKREFIDLYTYTDKSFFSLGSITVEVLKVTDAATNNEFSGLIFTKDSHTGYVDADEVGNLLKFFDYIETLETSSPAHYTEYEYNCKDLRVFAYYGKVLNKKPAWHYGIKVDQYYSESSIEIKLENMKELKEKIKNAVSNF